MSLLKRFQNHIQQNNLFSPKDKLLLAVSGGVDSVVLCELCKQAGYDFSIAHCNFQLRGEESERDEQFVKTVGKKYGVEIFVKKFTTEDYAIEKKISVQEAARELRYSWFAQLVGSRSKRIPLEESGVSTQTPEFQPQNSEPRTLNFLLTAHHADDNIETMLMNFFKGTGIAGLRGMLPKQGTVIRPLLFARKEELVAYANENKLDWAEDSSNLESKYSRNYFRNELLPLIKKIYPEAENNLAGNLQRFADIEVLYKQAIVQHKKKLLEQKGNEIHVPVLKLRKSEPLHSIVYEIIKDFGFSSHQTNEVIALLDSDSGKYIQSATHRVIKNRNWLIISTGQPALANTIVIEEKDKSIPFPAGMLLIKTTSIINRPSLKLRLASQQPTFAEAPVGKPATPSDRVIRAGSNQIACLDSKEIIFPLLLRKWKPGDYFYPLGMKKKKKLARFFIDQKLSKTEKENAWVLEMNRRIIWVVGYRIDERFKVTGTSKQVLQLTFKRNEML